MTKYALWLVLQATVSGFLMGFATKEVLDSRAPPLPTREPTTQGVPIYPDIGVLMYAKCGPASSTTTCVSDMLTQPDQYWSEWAMIVVTGEPGRCVHGFVSSSRKLIWTNPLPDTAAGRTFILLPAQECKHG